MVDPSGAVLTYNGEFFGFDELRSTLQAEGREFTSNGDTEVVLAALSISGKDALETLDGQFAFALWDPHRRRLLLVRDRIGIKPLFWAEVGRGIAFASEIPALLAHPGVRRDLAEEQVASWLQLGYGAGEHTLVSGVRRLRPGHVLEATADGIRIHRWYDPLEHIARTGARPKGRAEAVESLENLLRDAVKRRLVSDVPLGSFLSGGVDSAAVVAAAAAQGAKPETLTVSFEGGQDEGAAAARLAAAFDLPHRIAECVPSLLAERLSGWARATGDPLADPSFLPTSLVASEARSAWTVALSGDGGDELLSGYPRLRAMPRLERALALPRWLRRAPGPFLGARRWSSKLAAALDAPDRWSAYQALQGVWPVAAVRGLLGGRDVGLAWPQHELDRVAGLDPWTRWRALDVLTFLPERMLAKVDRASMGASLEVRVPLLDHRIVELLLGLDPCLTRGKGLLRDVLQRLGAPQPPARKIGFEVPLGAWLRGPLREPVQALVLGDTSAELGLDRRVLEATWSSHLSGAANHGERLLAVAVLVRWVEDVLG